MLQFSLPFHYEKTFSSSDGGLLLQVKQVTYFWILSARYSFHSFLLEYIKNVSSRASATGNNFDSIQHHATLSGNLRLQRAVLVERHPLCSRRLAVPPVAEPCYGLSLQHR